MEALRFWKAVPTGLACSSHAVPTTTFYLDHLLPLGGDTVGSLDTEHSTQPLVGSESCRSTEVHSADHINAPSQLRL
jgi:hypothetical protein